MIFFSFQDFPSIRSFHWSPLKVDIALDGDIGTIDVGSFNGHVDVGGPGGILPFNIQVVVGLEVGREAGVIAELAFPFNRKVSVVVDGRGDTVVVIKLLGNGDFLVVDRGSQLDVGVVVVVVHDNVLRIIFEVEARSDSDTSTIDIKSLGGFHRANAAGSGIGNKVDIQVSTIVVGIELNIGISDVEALAFGTGRDSPSRNRGRNLTPNFAWKGRNVGGGANRRTSTVGDIQISRLSAVFPRNLRVEAIQSIVSSIANRDLWPEEKKQYRKMMRS